MLKCFTHLHWDHKGGMFAKLLRAPVVIRMYRVSIISSEGVAYGDGAGGSISL